MKTYTLFFLLAIFLNSYSQDYKLIWQECIRTDNFETESRCLEVIGTNYLVGVYTNEPFSPNDNYHDNGDALYIMFDSIGNYVWSKCFGGYDIDQPGVIVYDGINNIYLINHTISIDGDVNCDKKGDFDIWVVKIDLLGNIIWQNCYGSIGYDEPSDAILTEDGGILVMSRINDGGGQVGHYYGYYDNWIIKLDTSGNLEWETTVGSLGRDNGLKLLRTTNDTYLALCGVNDNGGMSECTMMNDPSLGLDLWLVELDMDGNIIRQDCFGGTLDDLGYDIIENPDGYTIISKTESNDINVSGNHGMSDIWLLNISYDREIMWQKCLGGSNNDRPNYLDINENGEYTIIGATWSNDGDVTYNHGASDVWLVEADQDGNLLWEKTYGGQGMDWFISSNIVATNSDYEYLLAPVTYGNDGDVNCPDITGLRLTPWIFKVKDCSQFQLSKPDKPIGIDTLCVSTDSITTYSTTLSQNARSYHWEIIPENAGTCTQDSIRTYVHWNPVFEGVVKLKVRGVNDCGEGDWSDSLSIQTYMCLGIGDKQAMCTLKAYPNPATRELIVTYDKVLTTRLTNLQVINSYGILLHEAELNTGSDLSTIDVSKWSTGIYIVRIINEGGIVDWKKVVVND